MFSKIDQNRGRTIAHLKGWRFVETDEQYRDRMGDQAFTDIMTITPLKKAELRAEVFKTLAVNLVTTIRLYASTDHWQHQGIPFSACPHKPCPEARHIIDNAITIIAEKSEVQDD